MLPAGLSKLARRPLPVWWLRLRPLLLIVLIWAVFSICMTMAIYAEALRQGRSPHLPRLLALHLPYFVPVALYSACLYLFFERRPEAATRLGPLLRLYVLCVPAFVAADMLSGTAYSMWMEGAPWSQFVEALHQRAGYDVWVAMMVGSGAFTAQMAFSAWQLSQQRARAWAQAQTDNLGLRLALLQGQLEPHFLFNTLNSISALVRASDRGSALSALSRVSELLRYALRASRAQEVSVQDELQFARDYVELQTLRFGAGLQMRWQVADEAWESYACPPLLFQPLLENAIRHGLEAREGQGQVLLKLGIAAGEMQLRIDNELPEAPTSLPGHGVGLAATRERLQMLYGDAAGLQAGAEQGRYQVSLRMPLKELMHDDESTAHRAHR